MLIHKIELLDDIPVKTGDIIYMILKVLKKILFFLWIKKGKEFIFYDIQGQLKTLPTG